MWRGKIKPENDETLTMYHGLTPPTVVRTYVKKNLVKIGTNTFVYDPNFKEHPVCPKKRTLYKRKCNAKESKINNMPNP